MQQRRAFSEEFKREAAKLIRKLVPARLASPEILGLVPIC